MTQIWRLIEDGPSEPSRNMALDRAIQLAHARGEVPPTLRLYGWQRPTVTLGRFQSTDGVDYSACERGGVDIVRRFTGGRGVLHDDELTYSMVVGTRDGIPRGVAASYRVLCGVLAETYRTLGVLAELTDRPRGLRGSSACYLHATHADLSLDSAKLSGSAQVWHEDTCLQHGSFVRSRDIEREAAIFSLNDADTRTLARSTATFSDVLEIVPGYGDIASALVAALTVVFEAEVVRGEPTAKELKDTETLLEDVQVSRGF